MKKLIIAGVLALDLVVKGVPFERIRHGKIFSSHRAFGDGWFQLTAFSAEVEDAKGQTLPRFRITAG